MTSGGPRADALVALERLEAARSDLLPVQVPWADTLTSVLQARLDSLDEAARTGHPPPPWVRPAAEPDLVGWRCRDCGYARVSAEDAETWIARCLIPFHVGDRALTDPGALIETVLERRLIGTGEARRDLVSRTSASGIEITPDEGPMSNCPSCRSEETARYRWVPAGGGMHPLEE